MTPHSTIPVSGEMTDIDIQPRAPACQTEQNIHLRVCLSVCMCLLLTSLQSIHMAVFIDLGPNTL